MANMIFNLDLNKNNAINPIIFGRLTDGNLRKITVNITNEGEPVDLTDWVIRFEGTTGGQAKVFDVLGVQLLDAKNGKFEYTFSKTAFSATGAYRQAYFAIEKDNMRETTNDIKIVVENIADLDAQDAQTVVTELNKTITLINQRYAELNNRVDIYEGDIASLEEWLLGKKTEIENIIESANSTFNQKLSEIQAKLDETNQAIKNGDFYTKTETDQKLSAINTTITNHTNDKANPHSVTASQVGAYSKQEIDTKLSKAVMEDDSGKVTVSNTIDSGRVKTATVQTGYGRSAVITRIGNTVTITSQNQHSSLPANGSWQRGIGTLPVGFRPVADTLIYNHDLINTSKFSWNLFHPNGAIDLYSNGNIITSDYILSSGQFWITKDDFPN